jgi:outer membrane protein TolC
VANYRQTVLTAYQEVEDNLAAIIILSYEIQQREAAVRSAERNFEEAMVVTKPDLTLRRRK